MSETSGVVQGTSVIPLSIPPNIVASTSTLRISGDDANGPAFSDSASVYVAEPAVLLFLETDKPIYKPGQHIRVRALRLDSIDDAYTMAIAAYALQLAGSHRAEDANEDLLDLATAGAEGLYWSGPASVETIGYALLALLEEGDRIGASNAARWLVSQRNAFGGYGSTQDAVVGLQALIEHATHAKFDVDMTVGLTAGDRSKQVVINGDNADVVQIVELPESAELRLTAVGSGEVVTQVAQRFNMPAMERPAVEMFQIDVEYGAEHVPVDDTIDITARFAFTPPVTFAETAEMGMATLDAAAPDGFCAHTGYRGRVGGAARRGQKV